MNIRVRDQKEFAAGALFAVIGAAWAIRSFTYPLGTATSMGPGYFPLSVAIFLFCTGIWSVVRSVRTSNVETLGRWKALPVTFVLLGAAVFAVLIERVGVIVSTIALVAISSPTRLLSRPLEVAALAIITAAFVAGLFVYALGLSLPMY